MRWVTADRQSGKLLIRETDDQASSSSARPLAGFEESITARAVHELLFAPASSGGGFPFYPALVAARAAVIKGEAEAAQALVWIDPAGTFYPPAVAALGIAPEQVHVLRPRAAADVVWATAECLRCQGVGAVVALVGQRLSRVEVRRLQLAAERGSGVGVLVRPSGGAGADVYAAATRWRVTPAPGARGVQRWRLEMVHGHGGQGQSFILEKHRASGQANLVRPPSELVRHAIPAAAAAS